MNPLHIGNLTAALPIVQGGMGIGISLSGLAAAVANEGGIGVIAAAGIGMYDMGNGVGYVEANDNALRREIRKARELTRGIIGVNIMVALSNFTSLVRTAIEEGVDIIFSGAGLPLSLPALLPPDGCKTRLAPIVSSGKAAAIIAKRWLERFHYAPDAFVVEGPMAGGHLGFKKEQIDDPAFKLENLVQDVLDRVRPLETQCGRPIPVIAGGGIYTGADIRRFQELGAAGVQMATRFVTTEECDASPVFKQLYLDATPNDAVIIDSPVGMPGRALKNRFLQAVGEGQRKPFKCPYHCIVTCDVINAPYCIALALVNAKIGDTSDGFAFAGANVYRNDRIVTVKELVDTLTEEYEAAPPSQSA